MMETILHERAEAHQSYLAVVDIRILLLFRHIARSLRYRLVENIYYVSNVGNFFQNKAPVPTN
jgi:hypothetical protein